MLTLGLPEILVIAVIALLVVPTKDLPGLMRSVGQVVGKGRRMLRDFQRELDAATRVDELRDIEKQVADIRRKTEAEFAKDMMVPGTRGRYERKSAEALEAGATAKPAAAAAETAAPTPAPANSDEPPAATEATGTPTEAADADDAEPQGSPPVAARRS